MVGLAWLRWMVHRHWQNLLTVNARRSRCPAGHVLLSGLGPGLVPRPKHCVDRPAALLRSGSGDSLGDDLSHRVYNALWCCPGPGLRLRTEERVHVTAAAARGIHVTSRIETALP